VLRAVAAKKFDKDLAAVYDSATPDVEVEIKDWTFGRTPALLWLSRPRVL
jgi:hypothetical protein